MRFIEFGFADVPILAEAATQITTGRAETQDWTARQEMIERFLFNGIDGKAGRCSVAKGIKLAAEVFTDIAETGLTFGHTAKTRTERAKYSAVIFAAPPEGFFHKKNIALLCPRRKVALT